MLFSRILKKHRKRQCAWLYSIVFHGAVSACTITMLFLSFLIQPVHKAFAAEVSPSAGSPVVASEVAEHSPQRDDTEKYESRKPVEDSMGVSESTDSAEQVSIEEVVSEESLTPEIDEEYLAMEEVGASGDEEVSSPEISVEDGPGTEQDEGIAEDVSGVGVGISDDGGGSVIENDLSLDTDDSEDLLTREVEDEIGEPKPDTVIQLEGLVTEANYYQFSKQSCVAVGDGAYHCSTSTDSPSDTTSSVYVDRGESGNLEIFLRTASNRTKQITDNEFDDTAPHFDAESMRVVWQRLIDGRYQIILYDIKEEKETQLTFSRTNNMEPKVSPAGIVWQAWDSNDWEIMFFDGSFTEQLTNNSTQDVAPVIQDRYVVWNVLGGEEQQAQVYSLDTGETLSIQGYDGGVISNPRFVLVYDTKFDNGDIITQSFDPATGLSEPIAAQPAPTPIDIPDSDPVGEIRALISNKSKDESTEVAVDVVGDGGAPPVDSETLNLKTSVDLTDVGSISTSTEVVFELTEYDLVIHEAAFADALEAASSSAQE